MGTRDGEGGIRTPGTCYQVQRLSRAPDSATLAPLQVPAALEVPNPSGPEREGFEPPGPRSGQTVFKTASFDHSDTSPRTFSAAGAVDYTHASALCQQNGGTDVGRK